DQAAQRSPVPLPRPHRVRLGHWDYPFSLQSNAALQHYRDRHPPNERKWQILQHNLSRDALNDRLTPPKWRLRHSVLPAHPARLGKKDTRAVLADDRVALQYLTQTQPLYRCVINPPWRCLDLGFRRGCVQTGLSSASVNDQTKTHSFLVNRRYLFQPKPVIEAAVIPFVVRLKPRPLQQAAEFQALPLVIPDLGNPTVQKRFSVFSLQLLRFCSKFIGCE